MHLDATISGFRRSEYDLKEVRFKLDSEGSGYVLAIVKASTAEGDFIAFHKDVDFCTCLTGLADRIVSENLKWRPDVPYGSRGEPSA